MSGARNTAPTNKKAVPTSRDSASANPQTRAPGRRSSPHKVVDLSLELYRQQTLLTIMTGRMRETAGGLEQGKPADLQRLRRALEVHRRYLLELRYVDEERVEQALAKVEAAKPALAECVREHACAREFQRKAAAQLTSPMPAGGPAAKGLAKMFLEEADRIDRHQSWEQEAIHSKLDKWIPASVQARLLDEIRRFNATRVDAEVGLVSWASNLHPSSD